MVYWVIFEYIFCLGCFKFFVCSELIFIEIILENESYYYWFCRLKKENFSEIRF